MSISVLCPTCLQQLAVRDEYAGKSGKCPHCGQLIVVPPQAAHSSHPTPSRQQREPQPHQEDEPDPDTPTPQARAHRLIVDKMLLTAFLLGGLALGVWGMFAFHVYLNKPRTDVASQVVEKSLENDAEKKLIAPSTANRLGEAGVSPISPPLQHAKDVARLDPLPETKDRPVLDSPQDRKMFDVPKVVRNARPAVMTIVVLDARGEEVRAGSGFLVSADGILVTNDHVIRNARRAVARAEGGREYAVLGVLASDHGNDLAILKLSGRALPFLMLGDSGKMEPGMEVLVIGSPMGLTGSVTKGMLSAVRGQPPHLLLQISAAISSGSSGSPVLNDKGEVIGVARMASHDTGNQVLQMLNFAVPVEYVRDLLVQAKRIGVAVALEELVEEDMPEEPDEFAEPDEPETTPEADEWANNAMLHAEAKRWNDAATAFRRAAQLETKQKSAQAMWWSLAGEMYRRAGYVTTALSHLQYAVTVDRENAYCWYFLCAGQIEVGMRARYDKRPDESHYEHNKRLKQAYDDAMRTWRTLSGLDPELADKLDVERIWK